MPSQATWKWKLKWDHVGKRERECERKKEAAQITGGRLATIHPDAFKTILN